jgi:hypothetical protein
MAQEFSQLEANAKQLPADQIPEFLASLEKIRVIAFARLCAPVQAQEPDELVDVSVAARRLGVSETYLYHSHKKFSFARRVGRKLLFSSRGIEAHIRKAR